MYILEKTYHFDAAHKLENTESLTTKKCTDTHGHRWAVKVVISVGKLVDGMVIDFGLLKSLINKLDHKYLNEIVDFNPTAENLSKYLHQKIAKELTKVHTVYNLEVSIEESPGAIITYSGE